MKYFMKTLYLFYIKPVIQYLHIFFIMNNSPLPFIDSLFLSLSILSLFALPIIGKYSFC